MKYRVKPNKSLGGNRSRAKRTLPNCVEHYTSIKEEKTVAGGFAVSTLEAVSAQPKHVPNVLPILKQGRGTLTTSASGRMPTVHGLLGLLRTTSQNETTAQ